MVAAAATKPKKSTTVVFERIRIETINGKNSNRRRQVLLTDAPASYEKGVLYLGDGAKWTIKTKHLDANNPDCIQIKDRSMRIVTDTKIVELQTAAQNDNKNWERLQQKLQRQHAKFGNFLDQSSREALSASPRRRRIMPNKSNTANRRRRHKAFGKSAAHRRRMMMPESAATDFGSEQFSEDEQENAAMEEETDGDNQGNKNDHIGDNNTSSPSKSMGSKTDQEEQDEAEWSAEGDTPRNKTSYQSPKSRRRPHQNRRKRIQSLLEKDGDSDSDEDLFLQSSSPKLTTPFAQRIVSPSSATATKAAVKTTNTATSTNTITDAPATTDKANHSKKNIISSFFQAKSSTSSSSLAAVPRTPVRRMHSPAAARLIKSISSTTSSSKKKALVLEQSKTEDWLQSSQAAQSPLKQSSLKLFGSKTNTERKEDDPITEFDDDDDNNNKKTTLLRSPPRKRARLFTPSKTTAKPPTPRNPTIGLKLKKRIMPITLPEGEDVVEEPPVIRNPFRGLRNLGNTCYLNSSLQMLCTVPDLVDRLAASHANAATAPLTESVVQVARELRQPAQGVPPVNPQRVKDRLDQVTDKFLGYEQRDAHELLSDLVDHVHEEVIGGTEQTSPDPQEAGNTLPGDPTDDLKLTVQVCLECQSCGYSRTKDEIYRHLSVDIVSNKPSKNGAPSTPISLASVESGLENFFQPDVRELTCEKCKEGTHATQRMRILERPKVLLLHLKRFRVVEETVEQENAANGTYTTYVAKKDRSKVNVPEVISLAPFQNPETLLDQGSGKSQYSLKSVVHHIGGRASSGHYLADAVRTTTDESGEQKLEWFCFDDVSTAKTSIERVTKNPMKQSTAYMLLYCLDEAV